MMGDQLITREIITRQAHEPHWQPWNLTRITLQAIVLGASEHQTCWCGQSGPTRRFPLWAAIRIGSYRQSPRHTLLKLKFLIAFPWDSRRNLRYVAIPESSLSFKYLTKLQNQIPHTITNEKFAGFTGHLVSYSLSIYWILTRSWYPLCSTVSICGGC